MQTARANAGTLACVLLACLLLPACAHIGTPAPQADAHAPAQAAIARENASLRNAAWTQVQSIALPRRPGADERVLLEVRLGRFGAGQELVLRDADGALIGTVSPHGIRHGSGAGSYSVPVADAVLTGMLRAGGLRHALQLRVVLRVERAGAPSRAPHADEVLALRAVIAPR
jgi:hypothetical protein